MGSPLRGGGLPPRTPIPFILIFIVTIPVSENYSFMMETENWWENFKNFSWKSANIILIYFQVSSYRSDGLWSFMDGCGQKTKSLCRISYICRHFWCRRGATDIPTPCEKVKRHLPEWESGTIPGSFTWGIHFNDTVVNKIL